MLKKLAYFAAGFVLGGVTGFALTKKLIIDKMTSDIGIETQDEETSEIDISEAELDGEQVVSAKRTEEELPNYSAASDEAPKEEKIFRYEANKPRMTDYSKYGNKRTYMDEYEEEKAEEIDDEGDDLENFSPAVSLMDVPEYVSPNSYLSDYDHYDKVELTYYEGDDVLAEMDGGCELDVTEDVRNNLPSDYREHFGEYYPEQVDIRAHKVSTDYEIVRSKNFFYEEEDDEE